MMRRLVQSAPAGTLIGRSPLKLVICEVCVCGLLYSCSDPVSAPAPPTSRILTRVYIVQLVRPNEGFSFYVGETRQLRAEAFYSDNFTEFVTSAATWRTSNENVTTVSAEGLMRAVAPGDAEITVTYQGLVGRWGVLVFPPPN